MPLRQRKEDFDLTSFETEIGAGNEASSPRMNTAPQLVIAGASSPRIAKDL